MVNPRHVWALPTVEEVADQVFRVPLPMPGDGLHAVNVFIIPADDGVTLIDSGWHRRESRQALEDGLRHLGRSLTDVREFLVTHMHPDHYQQAAFIARDIGATVALGQGEAENLSRTREALSGDRDRLAPRLELLIRTGTPVTDELRVPPGGNLPATAVQGFRDPDEWLQADEIREAGPLRLRMIPTPGHTHGHMTFHDEGAALIFTGDHVLSQITPSIGVESAPGDYPLKDFMDSLRLVRSRPDGLLLPAHGPVRQSAHERVDELLSHHEVRLDDSRRAVVGGARTVYEVARELSWTYNELTLDDLNVANQVMAIQETEAHLRLLVLTGKLVSVERDGEATKYSPPPAPEAVR